MIAGEAKIPLLKCLDGNRDSLSFDFTKITRDDHGDEALEEIKEETNDAVSFSKGAKDIGSTDISGTVFTDIEPLKLPDQKTKGDGAK